MTDKAEYINQVRVKKSPMRRGLQARSFPPVKESKDIGSTVEEIASVDMVQLHAPAQHVRVRTSDFNERVVDGVSSNSAISGKVDQ